jgi:hypothetical protein
MNFKDTMVLARIVDYLDRLVKEATEIHLHPDNFNRDWIYFEVILVLSHQHTVMVGASGFSG